MQEYPQTELSVDVGDDQQNAIVEQLLSAINIDEFIACTLRQAGITQQVILTVLITDEDGIHDLNKRYRQQDKPTDVLSFPLLDRPLVNAPADHLWAPRDTQAPTFVTPPGIATHLGDIVISWPTVVRQAVEAGHSSTYELVYLLCHGVLHLIGYDDHTEAGYQAMVSIQRSVLQALGQTFHVTTTE